MKQNIWTNDEKQTLIELYPSHSNKELAEILHKTDGSIRSMKTKLGLNTKFKPFTENEKLIIENYYNTTDDDYFDLEYLSKLINRQKTSISRYARKVGLTKSNRKPSLASVEKQKEISNMRYQSEDGEKVKQKISNSLKVYFEVHEHPKGMLGKHHTPDVCAKMSKSHIEYFSKLSDEEKSNIAKKSARTRAIKGTGCTSQNAYSNCKQGFRDDLNCYFRSSWEANFARILTYNNIKWEYECQRFVFPYESGGILSYQPDFYLPEYDLWIEIKGWMDEKSKLRLEMFRQFYPEYQSKFVLIEENFYYFLMSKFKNQINSLEKVQQVKKYKKMEWAEVFIREQIL